jgi:hypothetical protein
MALINPSTLYSGGQGIFDTTPYRVAIQKAQAQKAAKDEALNQYYNKLGDSLNTAGVRLQELHSEIGGILKDIEQWKVNAMSDRGNIKNGGMPQQQHMALYQSILNKIAQSKARAKTELEMGKAKFEGTYNPEEEDLSVIDKIHRSIYDPASYKEDGVSEYGWADTSKAIPDFDPQKQTQFFNAAIGKAKPTYDEKNARVDEVTGSVFIPMGYAPESVQSIATSAGNLFEGSKIAKKHYKNLMTDEVFMTQANNAYQEVFGKDAHIETPKQLAQADAILRTRETMQDVKVTDKALEQRLKKEIIEIKRKNALEKQAIAERGKNNRAYAYTNKVTDPYDVVVANVVELPTAVYNPNSIHPLKAATEKLASLEGLSGAEKQDLLGKPNARGQYPVQTVKRDGVDYLRVNEQGELTDANGEKVDRDEALSNKLARTGGANTKILKGQVARIPVGKATPKTASKQGEADNL